MQPGARAPVQRKMQQQKAPKFARYNKRPQEASTDKPSSTSQEHAAAQIPARYRRSPQITSSASSPALSSASLSGAPSPHAQTPPLPVVRATAARSPETDKHNTSPSAHPLASPPVYSPAQPLPHDVTTVPRVDAAQLWPPIEYTLDMPRQRNSDTPGHALYTPQAIDKHDSPIDIEKTYTTQGPRPSRGSGTEQGNIQTIASDDEEGHRRRFACFRFRRHNRSSTRSPEVIAQPPEATGPHAFIKQGGGGIVPGTDAPKSAANAGERRVDVYYENLSVQLPVDLETTPHDLLCAAASRFLSPIDPKTVVLVEYYSRIGIQRPLRRYEHVRDVVNSWDTENNNKLVIKGAKDTGADPSLLHASTVTREQPKESSFELQYSQRPGKWSQRNVTIQNDGQITCAKKPGDKTQSNVCHLSDFDIYMPTPEALRKKLRPPKEHCVAIKSQQPTNLFETKDNFVHFFSTADRTTAVRFYVAVQAWRSWYLVNQLGEGNKRPQPTQSQDAQNTSPRRRPSTRTQTHKQSTHPDEVPYRLGSMKPLMDTSNFDVAHSNHDGKAPPTRQRSVRGDPSAKDKQRPGQPLLSENEPLANMFPDKTTAVAANAAIIRSQSMRQTRATQPTRVVSPTNEAAGARPGTSDGSEKPQMLPASSTESKRRSADITRSKSKREQPKPLIDLTPAYRPPPQHLRKGRGVKNENGGLLVEAATTPADPINAPPAVDWRGMNGSAAAAAARQTHAVVPVDNPAQTGRRPSAAEERSMSMKAAQADSSAFVRGGLVENVPTSVGGQTLGRGVMQGSSAKGPMVDLSEPSQYAPGSLLARQENVPP